MYELNVFCNHDIPTPMCNEFNNEYCVDQNEQFKK